MKYIIDLSEDDKRWCKVWLRSHTYVIACLTNTSDFNEYSLRKLICYESQHRQRTGLLVRMTARYAKLRRKREWQELVTHMRRINLERERERYRKISM